MPVIQLRDAGLAGRVRDSIDNAIRVVAKCRHSQFGDLALNAIIATETILNPFNSAGDIAERFSLLAAALTESDAGRRREKYTLAKALYRERCHAVHRSRMDGEVEDSRKQAFTLFVDCLLAILRWASARIKSGEAINKEAFEQMYLHSIFD